VTFVTPALTLIGSSYYDVEGFSWFCANVFRRIATPSVPTVNNMPRVMRLHVMSNDDGEWSHNRDRKLLSLQGRACAFLPPRPYCFLTLRNLSRFDLEMEFIE